MSHETRIAEMKQKGDLNGLVKITKNDDEWMFRMDAAEALAQLGDKRGLKYLISALDDADMDVRDVAREILEGLNDQRGNQALQKPRKLITEPSRPDSSSENLVVNKGKIRKENGSINKKRQRNEKSFSQTAIIIVIVAGLIILWDSVSWSKGGVNGLISMAVVFLAIFLLGAIFLGKVVNNFSQPKEKKSKRKS